jgi:two-component system C4-dicarboxylate transport sensor histidine kinase DctB
VLYLMLVLVTSGESSRARSVRRGAEELLWFGVLWWAWSFGIWGLTLGLTGLVVLFSLQEPSDQELRQSLAQQMHVTESTLRVSQQRFQRDTHRFQNLLWQQETLDEFQLRALQTENEGALSQLLLDSVTALERGCQAAIWRLSSESPQQSALVASSPFPLHQFEPLPPECRQGQAVRSVDGGKYYYPLTGELLFVALRQAPQSEKEQQRQELTDHMLGRARLIFRILEQKRQLATLLVEKTRALEQLAESQSQLVQSEKLASIGQLAAGVAHEINSPLAAISLQAQLARRRLAKNDSDGVLRSLETCEQASLKAKAIIENLLAFAQFSDGSRQALRLQEVVEQTMQLLEAHLEQASIETRVRMGPELSPVQANAQEVSQILTNILTNAVDALAARPEGRRIAVGATQNEREQSLTISNNGPLIPAEHLEKLFDPFFTTKEIGQGTGLGLSLAYQLARSNGGNLIVSNGEGWVRFTLTLPLGVAPE